ncbi:MAG: hypothetical protein ACOCVJ_01440 [Verrucomicrobiota bacterium]
MAQLPPSAQRVRQHTEPQVQAKIDHDTVASIRYHSTQTLDVIDTRIAELDREWDIERVLESNASTLALSGVALGLLSSRKWLFLTGGVLVFLLQHATQGWCPPLAVLRRCGVRTRREIDIERNALKALRGDYLDQPGLKSDRKPLSIEDAMRLVDSAS